MICLLALIFCGILGIFSATYRRIAIDAFDCVFRKATLRPCNTGLDKRLKVEITTKLFKYFPRTGKHVFKYFQWYSWTFTILTFVSLYFLVLGFYNYVEYGNCNGPLSTAFCIFNPSQGKDVSFSNPAACAVGVSKLEQSITKPNLTGLEPVWYGNGTVEVIEFGCYTCNYTHQSEPDVAKLRANDYNTMKFAFIPFPIPSHPGSYMTAKAAYCAQVQNQFWNYHDLLMKSHSSTNETLISIAQSLSMNIPEFTSCLASNSTQKIVDARIKAGIESGIYGTPTFFFNSDSIVGPQSYRILSNYLNKNK